jgi:hypothetical protein
MDKSLTLASNICAGIGIILLCLGGYRFYKEKQFRATAVQTEGIILDTYARISNSQRRTAFSTAWVPLIGYISANGEPRTYTSRFIAYLPSTLPGTKVQIYYDKNDPEHVQMEGVDGFFGAFLLMGFGLFFVLFRVIYYVIGKNK